jgi:acyl-coenzyme A synthetase/AMP-(fatty) acid ligase
MSAQSSTPLKFLCLGEYISGLALNRRQPRGRNPGTFKRRHFWRTNSPKITGGPLSFK